MNSLSETLARLSTLRVKRTVLTKGQDRLFDLTDFGSNPGALRARTYIPDGLTRNAPLVVVLHGCTQTAAGYDHGAGWSQLAEEQGFALLFPEQQRSNNPNLCFNWFVPEDIRRGGGEALSIRQMIETLVGPHGLDRGRIFITGLSAGGAMTSVMLATYAEIFAGGAIIAGLPFGGATTIPEAFESMRGNGTRSELRLQSLVRSASPHKGPWPTISIWQGSADHTVDLSNAAAIVDQWREVHGLGQTPPHTEVMRGHTRRFWCDAQGKVLIEEYIIVGMGHGTPLNPGEDGLGNSGPFMLDVGISSTRHIARSWGIVKSGIAGKMKRTKTETEAPNVSASPINRTIEKSPKPRLVDKNQPTPEAARPLGIKTVIENALRKAGLMG